MARRTTFQLVALDSADAQRRAGRVMVGVAMVGVIVAVIGGVVGWQFVGRLDSTGGETLDVTVETLDTLSDTIDLADGVLGSTVAALEAVGATLDALVDSFDSADAVITEVGSLAGTAAPARGDATATLRDLEGIGATIDAMLEDLSDLPLAPNYDPAAGLGESIGSLADTLEPLSEEFATTSSEVATFSEDLTVLRGTIEALDTTIGEVNSQLAGTDSVIDDYRLRVAEARDLADETAAGIDGDTRWMRILLVLGAANFAVGQIVPWWIGRELLDRARATAVAVAEAPRRRGAPDVP